MITSNISQTLKPNRSDGGLTDIVIGAVAVWLGLVNWLIITGLHAIAHVLFLAAGYVLFAIPALKLKRARARYVYPRLGYAKLPFTKQDWLYLGLYFLLITGLTFAAIPWLSEQLLSTWELSRGNSECIIYNTIMPIYGLVLAASYLWHFLRHRAAYSLILTALFSCLPIMLISLPAAGNWRYTTVCYLLASGLLLIFVGAFTFAKMLRLPVLNAEQAQ